MREAPGREGDGLILELAFKNAPDALVVVDAETGRLVAANRAARDLGVDLDDLAACDSVKAAARRTGESGDVRVTGRDGAKRVLAITAARADDRHAVVSLRDVTRQRAAEAELRRHRRVDSLGHLTASVIHDFNNVLAPIAIAAEWLNDGVADEHRTALALTQLRSATDSALGLVRQLLGYVRRTPPPTRALCPSHVLLELRPLLDCVAGARVQVDLAVDDEGLVDADRDGLERALFNLVANARDAMPRGGRVAITTSSVRLEEGDYVSIAVSDGGEGMSPEVRERLFEAFVTTKGDGEGLGLGLASVHRFVSDHGGLIQVASDVGRGTTVRVCLPRSGQSAPLQASIQTPSNR
jgi:signal transduction histidine kinase